MKEETRRKREREGKEEGGEGGWRSRKCVEVVKSGRLQEREREREREREGKQERQRESKHSDWHLQPNVLSLHSRRLGLVSTNSF